MNILGSIIGPKRSPGHSMGLGIGRHFPFPNVFGVLYIVYKYSGVHNSSKTESMAYYGVGYRSAFHISECIWGLISSI